MEVLLDDFHELLELLILLSDDLVEVDDLELFLEPRLLSRYHIPQSLPLLDWNSIILGVFQLVFDLVYFVVSILQVDLPFFSLSTAFFEKALSRDIVVR